MSATLAIREDDLRGKIETVLSKLDRIESRVKSVEAVAAIVPKLEKKLSKVESRVEERFEAPPAPPAKPSARPIALSSPPLPVKAFVGGASIGVMIIGAITAGWLLGIF